MDASSVYPETNLLSYPLFAARFEISQSLLSLDHNEDASFRSGSTELRVAVRLRVFVQVDIS